MSLTEIKALTLSQFKDIYDEVTYQESVKSYETAMYVANILAGIENTIPRKGGRGKSGSDFIKIEPPQRGKVNAKEDFKEMTKQAGIKLPSK